VAERYEARLQTSVVPRRVGPFPKNAHVYAGADDMDIEDRDGVACSPVPHDPGRRLVTYAGQAHQGISKTDIIQREFVYIGESR